jgi:hypothetical protein
MDLENVVRFSSHPRPFVVRDTYCSNPDCDCNAVQLTFTEVNTSTDASIAPLSFMIHVELDTWLELKPSRLPQSVAGLVREFLAECPASRRAEFKASYEEQKRDARRIAEYRLNAREVLAGELVSYISIQTDERPLSAGGNAYAFELRWQGRRFLVEDRYCANPGCDCQSVTLEFFEVVTQADGQNRIYQRFLGRVMFEGRLIVDRRMQFPLADATAVLTAWREEYGDELKLFERRYEEVKEIGQRSLEDEPIRRPIRGPRTGPTADDSLSAESPPAHVELRRNAPCPCGSGKKYKKCCGRRAAMPQ